MIRKTRAKDEGTDGKDKIRSDQFDGRGSDKTLTPNEDKKQAELGL